MVLPNDAEAIPYGVERGRREVARPASKWRSRDKASSSEKLDEVTEDVRNRAVEGVESVDENGFNMDTGSDRLVATIGQRVNVRLERGVVLAMHYVPIKFDRHQVLGRDVGVRDAVRRDHEAVLVGDPNAEVTWAFCTRPRASARLVTAAI